eukprot:16322025-Heterocapsa_arctica.AAC.1
MSANFLYKSLVLTSSGSQSYRGGPSLSSSDAQRHVEPEKCNGSQQNVNGSLNSGSLNSGSLK